MDCFAEPVIGPRFARTRWLAMTSLPVHPLRCHRPRRRATQYSRDSAARPRGRGVLDRPPEPVIQPAEGRTGWRATTTEGLARAFKQPEFSNSQIETHHRILAARCVRGLRNNCAIRKSEGAGNAGCPMHPQPRVRLVVLVCTRVFTAEAPETSGIPHAMVLTAYIALSPGTGLSCPRRSRSKPRDLNASVGAPGPHDFAVRSGIARPAPPLRPPHPTPRP
jgi:hypothetical protein